MPEGDVLKTDVVIGRCRLCDADLTMADGVKTGIWIDRQKVERYSVTYVNVRPVPGRPEKCPKSQDKRHFLIPNY